MLTTYIALLRGINVGGNNKLPMAELRTLLATLGCQDVKTYIQSGNAVFAAPASDDLATRISAAISERFGLTVPVILRTRDELAQVPTCNPFPTEGDADPSKLLVTFLDQAPDPAVAAALHGHRSPHEAVDVVGREVYIWCPNGISEVKLKSREFKQVMTSGTGRNLRTVQKLLEMAAE